MTTKMQIMRSSVTGKRPTGAGLLPGELYINFADKIFGYIDASGTAVDLDLRVPTAGPTFPATPKVNDLHYKTTSVVGLYVYLDDGTSKQWVQGNGIGPTNIYTKAQADTAFVNVTGDTMTGALQVDNANIALNETGGTDTITLAAASGTITQVNPASGTLFSQSSFDGVLGGLFQYDSAGVIRQTLDYNITSDTWSHSFRNATGTIVGGMSYDGAADDLFYFRNNGAGTLNGALRFAAAGDLYITSAFGGGLADNLTFDIATGRVGTAASLRELKKEITDLQDGHRIVMALQPVEYEWRAEEAVKGKRLGFIAQDVWEVDPRLKTTQKYETDGIVAALVQTCQVQQEMINDLRAEVEALKGAN